MEYPDPRMALGARGKSCQPWRAPLTSLCTSPAARPRRSTLHHTPPTPPLLLPPARRHAKPLPVGSPFGSPPLPPVRRAAWGSAEPSERAARRGAGRAGRALSAVHTPVQLSGARGASPVTAPVPGGKASALSASPPGTLPRGGSRAESPPPPLPPGGPGRPRWGEPG